ncbi:hypothetical protein ACUTAH_25135 [Metapseudomonas furukawaii]|jgi:hypothetical protein|uniref:hypothetical protein n=1 Tax=Metapseudomonas furukawaii TaxID=1149133 RepID=UPI00227CF6B3|nr:hypothetical protein [Pseudomonas furukawaii]WAG76832.1 hypothetical protein LMK08_15750 [Pseudomonas furukawaii]
MGILKLVILLLAAVAGGQAFAQQPWTPTDLSGQMVLARDGGGHGKHGARHYRGPRHGYGYYGNRHGYKPYYRHHHYYSHRPRFIVSPRYYGGIVVGPQPYYYQRYSSPRIVIQYYDPRLGIFIGTDLRDY